MGLRSKLRQWDNRCIQKTGIDIITVIVSIVTISIFLGAGMVMLMDTVR